MAHRSGDTKAEPELRQYLLGWAREFRRDHVEIMLDRDHPQWAEQVWAELSKAVDQLANGEAHCFSGFLLPDDHPMRSAYLHANVVLDEHDVLRVVL